MSLKIKVPHTVTDNEWGEWKKRALAALRLEDVYGDWLTGRASGEWLECRDRRGGAKDDDPSAGVADGSGTYQRGGFKSFRDGEWLTVFDFLVVTERAADFHEAQKLVAELSGVPLPTVKPTNGKAEKESPRGSEKPEGDSAPKSSGFAADWIDSVAFAAMDCRPRWVVKRLLARGQPVVIGGPKKALKTSLLVDMGVSLGTATNFLGAFEVPERLRVVILSGESGEYTLQETGKRVCKARGIGLADAGVLWGFRLPQLANPTDLAVLKEGLLRDKVDVAIIDPLYLCLLAGQSDLSASNLFDMGPVLLAAARACLDVSCTPLLVHHARKLLAKPFEPLELEDLAFAGIQEFARQWLLLSRREAYEPGTGLHKLWLSAGGSIGHGGLWGLDIDEGVLDDNFEGRTWNVLVRTAAEVREGIAAVGDARKQKKESAMDKSDDGAILATLDRLSKPVRAPEAPKKGKRKRLVKVERGVTEMQAVTRKKLEIEAKLSHPRAERAVTRLLGAGIVEEVDVVVKSGRNNAGAHRCKGIRRVLVNGGMENNGETNLHSIPIHAREKRYSIRRHSRTPEKTNPARTASETVPARRRGNLMIHFDHMKLVRRAPAEVARFRRFILGVLPGEPERVIIEHETNGSCCKREAWNTTAASIITALEPPTPQVLINMNDPEGATR
jgi:hypothetical protein